MGGDVRRVELWYLWGYEVKHGGSMLDGNQKYDIIFFIIFYHMDDVMGEIDLLKGYDGKLFYLLDGGEEGI